MLRQGSLQIVRDHPILFLCAGLMGFVVNVLSFWVIRMASGLTLKVLATVKNTLLVVIGAVFLSETVTGLQTTGYVITMIGFVWYQAVYVPPPVQAQQKNKKNYEYEPVHAQDDQLSQMPSKFGMHTISSDEITSPLNSATNGRASCSSSSSNSICSGRRRLGTEIV
jgi:hypothetical protein